MSRRSRRTSCIEMHRKRRSRDFTSSAKVASPPSRPLSSASASSGRSQRDLSPCPEHRVSFREQAMAMHLSGRDKHRVMEAVSGKPNMAMGKEPARANGDCSVDKVNSVTEGRDEPIEPISQSGDARRLGSPELVRWPPRSRRVRRLRERPAHGGRQANVEAPTFATTLARGLQTRRYR
jgi:hypothetical protein